MKPAKGILIIGISLSLGLSACLDLKQPSNKIEYYSLEYEPPRFQDLQPVSNVISVELFDVSPIYNTRKIIYRDKSFKRAAYGYHRWHANPGEFVTHFLIRDMQQSRVFKAVVPGNRRFPGAAVLSGSVDEFLEADMPEGWQAVLSVSIILMAGQPADAVDRILFQKTYTVRKPCRQKNPRALAEAMSQAMSEASARIIKDVYQRLAQNN
jgi:cholesterol transport system auxiliary component